MGLGLAGNVLVGLSCAISALGAVSVALSCFISAEAQKPARRLLLFLSISDFGTSVNYLLAILFPAQGDGTAWCKLQADLGIFFPLASFIWTTCVAVFLYLTLVYWPDQRAAAVAAAGLAQQRGRGNKAAGSNSGGGGSGSSGGAGGASAFRNRSGSGDGGDVAVSVSPGGGGGGAREQGREGSRPHTIQRHQKLFQGFHLVAWGLPALICVVVTSADVLGRSEPVTGGWCWIKDDLGHSAKVLWEIVGGKLVEWVCLLATCTLYGVMYVRVRRRRKEVLRPTSHSRRDPGAMAAAGSRSSSSELAGAGGAAGDGGGGGGGSGGSGGTASTSTSTSTSSSGPLGSHRISGSMMSAFTAGFGAAAPSTPSAAAERLPYSSPASSSAAAAGGGGDGGGGLSSSSPPPPRTPRRMGPDAQAAPAASPVSPEHAARVTLVAQQRKRELKDFERKLLFVPAIFFFVRIWGSARTVIDALGLSATHDPEWMQLAQGIFDPAQGFFNALLFVVFSAKARRGVLKWLAKCSSSRDAACAGCCECVNGLFCCGGARAVVALTLGACGIRGRDGGEPLLAPTPGSSRNSSRSSSPNPSASGGTLAAFAAPLISTGRGGERASMEDTRRSEAAARAARGRDQAAARARLQRASQDAQEEQTFRLQRSGSTPALVTRAGRSESKSLYS